MIDGQPSRYTIKAPKRFFLRVVLPVAVFLGSELMMKSLGFFELQFDPKATPDLLKGNEAAALAQRYRYLAFTLGFVVVSLVCIIFSALDIVRKFRDRSLHLVIFGIAFVAAVVLIQLLLFPKFGLTSFTYELVGRELFQDALSSMQTGSPRFGNFFSAFNVLANLNSVLILGVTSLLISGATAVACSEPEGVQDQEELLLTRLHRQSGDFRTYIYLSSLFLVFGVLQMQSWLDFPAYAFSPEPQRKVFEALSDSVSLFYAMSFSMILVVFALPGFLILRANSERLIARKIRTIRSTTRLFPAG
jgi:hypothetical protein